MLHERCFLLLKWKMTPYIGWRWHQVYYYSFCNFFLILYDTFTMNKSYSVMNPSLLFKSVESHFRKIKLSLPLYEYQRPLFEKKWISLDKRYLPHKMHFSDERNCNFPFLCLWWYSKIAPLFPNAFDFTFLFSLKFVLTIFGK